MKQSKSYYRAMGVVHHTTAGDPHKDPCCSVFGCGRILTPQEQLYGNKCINHSKTVRPLTASNIMADQILPQGVRFFNKNAKAPDFVIGTLVLTPDDINAFCIDNESLMTEYNGKKQLRLQVLKSKEGNLYAAVDTWKPDAAPAAQPGFKAPPLPEENDLPF